MSSIGEGVIRLDHQAAPTKESRVVLLSRDLEPTIDWTAPLTAPESSSTVTVEELAPSGWVLVDRRLAPGSGQIAVQSGLRPWRRYRAKVDVEPTAGAAGWSSEIEFEAPAREVPATWIEIDRGRGARLRYTAVPGARHRLVVAAQAVVRPLLDGRAVCPSTLLPTRTDLARSLYRMIDLEDGSSGERELDLLLGVGEWGGVLTHPRLCAVVLADDRVVAATDADTAIISSGVLEDWPFVRESLDHAAVRRELTVERARALDRDVLGIRSERPDLTPVIAATEPLRVTELHRRNDVRVYQVPVNIAGRSRVTVHQALPPKTVLRVVHGEQLDDAGRVDTTNIALPDDRFPGRQIVEHRVRGVDGEVLEAWFAFHGFRYLEIEGLPAEATLTVEAVPIHTLIEPISNLDVDDSAVEAIMEMANRTLLNNVHGIPEDCPTREQSGWTGDSAAVAEFTFASHDVQNFYDKWLGDMATSQRDDGSIPGVVPGLSGWKAPVDPVWAAALPRLMLLHWLNYGDERVVSDHLPTLERWVDALLSWRDAEGVVSRAPFSFGHDWLSLDPTPPDLMHTVAAIEAIETEARLREDLDEQPERSAVLHEIAASMRAAARTRFVHADGVANDSQGALGWAVIGGLLTPDERAQAMRALAEDIQRRGGRLTTGFAGTRGVVLTLGRSHPGVLRAVLSQPATPGAGAMLASDIGTLWESWWHDPANNGTGSLDHLGLAGPIAGWAWTTLAGVAPTAAGWSEFEILPRLISTIETLRWTRRTPRGVAALSIQRHGDNVELDVLVPAGSVARLGDEMLPSGRHSRRLPLPVDEVLAPALDEAPWVPPARIAVPRDESAAVRFAWAGLGSEADGLRCAPVSHGQLAGPTWLASDRDADRALTATARVEQLFAPDTGFVFVWLDICRAAIAGVPDAELTAHWDNGAVSRSRTRVWHAGWTRAVLRVEERHRRLVGVTVRLVRPAGEADDAEDAAAVLALGPVGWSPAAPRW